jgi:hypothetical protein
MARNRTVFQVEYNTILDLNKIEQIQHQAARIVTGLPKFASIESLYLFESI